MRNAHVATRCSLVLSLFDLQVRKSISMRKLSVVVFSLWSISVAAAQAESPVAGEAAPAVTPYRPVPALPEAKHSGGIHWGPLLREWWLNLVMEQTERIVKESKTRDQLSGPFFHDWFNTVSNYHFDRWDDDDKFVTSNLGHPTQGAIVAAIFWQNNDHVAVFRPGLPQRGLPQGPAAGLRIRHRRCCAVETRTPERIQYRQCRSSRPLVGQRTASSSTFPAIRGPV